ncbi:MAG: ECF-type sigma factor [Planctomycetota bacterium]
MMQEEEPITHWIQCLRQGDQEAAQELWRVFFDRLKNYAAKKLGELPKRVSDEDDVALSAFHSVVRGVQDDTFKRMESREDFWQLLVVIAARKASNLHRKQRQRREAGESVLANAVAVNEHPMGTLQDDNLEEQDLAMYFHCTEILEQLPGNLQTVVLMRMSGYSNAEIAGRIGRSMKTVEHYFRQVRAVWADLNPDIDAG